jgi:hypothetical protein
MQLDFSECKSKRDKEALMRKAVNDVIYNALIKNFGVEKVAEIDENFETDGGSFKKDTLVVEVTELTDTNGFPVAPLAEISIKIRTWNSNSNKAVFFNDIIDHYENKKNESEGD